jgi:enterochelin esterase-like enzyme
MQQEKTITTLLVEQHIIVSKFLNRPVTIHCFLPTHVNEPQQMSLLLINDGQNMEELSLEEMLDTLLTTKKITPVLCVAIHANENRKMEYGTAHCPDYLGRGVFATAHTNFVLNELLPFIYTTYCITKFKEMAYAGFSLGGLSALDIVWNYPGLFTKAGVFSGSLWCRTKSLDDGYNENTDRIMHAQVRAGDYKKGLRFFFETGTQDETADRNHNGIIDSIDDTLSLIKELTDKGYHPANDIYYLELQDGKHDIATWARAMPVFLQWGWGRP